jgi:hypothetical protein
LRKVADRFWGRQVSYELAARYATDEELRREYEGHCRSVESVEI